MTSLDYCITLNTNKYILKRFFLIIELIILNQEQLKHVQTVIKLQTLAIRGSQLNNYNQNTINISSKSPSQFFKISLVMLKKIFTS